MNADDYKEKLTFDDVVRLIETIMSGMRSGDAAADRTFSLKEVSERTGFAYSSLVKDCRAGLIEHTHRGDSRSMTSQQVAKLLARHACGGDLAYRVPGHETEHQEAIRLSLRNARRATPRRKDR